MTEAQRGKTDGGFTVAAGSKGWTLDELGNWKDVTTLVGAGGGSTAVTETRAHNSSNEIRNIGTVNRYYDLNGNLVLASTAADGQHTSAGAREKLTFDPWNRLVKVQKLKDPRQGGSWDTVEYEYNGLHWRVKEKRTVAATAPVVPPPDGAPAGGETFRYHFYSNQWQQLLEVEATVAAPAVATRHEQQFWGLRGIDDAILRRTDVEGDGVYTDVSDRARYQLTDSSFSVVAHVNASNGQVHQWMSYDAFGTLKILLQGDFNGDGTVTQDDMLAFSTALNAEDPAADINGDGTVDEKDVDPFVVAFYGTTGLRVPDEVRIGYAGYVRDRVTDKLLARHRWYEPLAGRWISRDPAGYVDGLDMYLYVRGNPLSMVDPMGLAGDEKVEWHHALPQDVFNPKNETGNRSLRFKGIDPNKKEFGRVMKWEDHRGGPQTGDPSNSKIHKDYNKHWEDWIEKQEGKVTLHDVRTHLKEIEESTGNEHKAFREWLSNGVKANRSYEAWKDPSYTMEKKTAWFEGKVDRARAALRNAVEGATVSRGAVSGSRYLETAGSSLKKLGWIGLGAAMAANASAVYAGQKTPMEGVIDTVSPIEVQDYRNVQTMGSEWINNLWGNGRANIGHMDSTRSLDGHRPLPLEQR